MNIEKAITLCRELEAIVRPFGWHVGLTGGCLYKDGDRKDVDVIVYPHDPAKRPNRSRMIDAVSRAIGVDDFVDGPFEPSCANKDIVVLKGEHCRVDLFILS